MMATPMKTPIVGMTQKSKFYSLQYLHPQQFKLRLVTFQDHTPNESAVVVFKLQLYPASAS